MEYWASKCIPSIIYYYLWNTVLSWVSLAVNCFIAMDTSNLVTWSKVICTSVNKCDDSGTAAAAAAKALPGFSEGADVRYTLRKNVADSSATSCELDVLNTEGSLDLLFDFI